MGAALYADKGIKYDASQQVSISPHHRVIDGETVSTRWLYSFRSRNYGLIYDNS